MFDSLLSCLHLSFLIPDQNKEEHRLVPVRVRVFLQAETQESGFSLREEDV